MQIPKIYPISPSHLDTKEFINSLKGLKFNQQRTFQYRRKNLDPFEVVEELNLVQQTCKQEKINFIINSFHASQFPKYFSGIHLTSKDLNKHIERPIGRDKLLGASCHNKKDILKAELLKVDYIFLSPIKKTQSHPHQKCMGWKDFSTFVRGTNLPVLALGGLVREDLNQAQRNGAYGIAGISRFWSN